MNSPTITATNTEITRSTQPTPLSVLLREQTSMAHQNAEGASFIKMLFSGKASDQSYVNYLWALGEIYQSLETALAIHKNHPAVRPIYFPELDRRPSLQADLSAWSAIAEPKLSQTTREAVQKYCDRIRAVASEKPELLVAHAYVRYLGDLSGGQILGKVLGRQYGLDRSLAFYDFSNLDSAETKKLYRERLDEIGAALGIDALAIADEAVLVFELNSEVFNTL